MPKIEWDGLPDKEPVEVSNLLTLAKGIDWEGLPDKEVSPEPSPDLPVWKQAPDVSFIQKTWNNVLETFSDPEKESSRAVLALVDAENLGISPEAAYRLRDTIDAGIEFNPQAAMKRSSFKDRVAQSWDIGLKQNNLGELGYQFVITGDPQYLDRMDKIGFPSEEDTFVSEGRIESAVRSAAKLLPMTVDITKEAGYKGVALGLGFGTISLLAGQPELAYPAGMAGLRIGAAEGMVEGSLRKEAGLAVYGLTQMKDKDGNEMSHNTARAAAFGVGAFNSVLEVTGIKILLKSIPGADRLFADAMLKTVANKSLKNRLMSLALEYGSVTASETGIELAQESVNIIFEELSKVVENEIKGTDFEPVQATEIIDRLRETATEAAQGFAVIAAPGIILKGVMTRPGAIDEIEGVLPEETKAIYEAEKARALSEGADETTAATKAVESIMDTPEVKQKIDEMAAEVPAPTMESLMERLQTEDLTEEELGSLLDEFAGGREIIEEMQSEPVTAIKERLVATGMDEVEASANAALFDGFRVLAQRAGVSVEDVMARYLPEISREGAEVITPIVTEADRKAITDNPFLSDQITTDEQLANVEGLRTARERINETLVEQREEQTVSDEEMKQLEEAVGFLDKKITRSEVPLAQPAQEGIAEEEPRGRIRISPDGINIDLLKGADQSTFVHETGHLYYKMLSDLAVLPTAAEDLKADYQTVRDWLGAEEGVDLSVDQQEQFARGFEAYLREGKAPSSALAEAFENFKQWLMQVYKSLRDLNVHLTDEVRGVMDRMLADEGVERAEVPEGVLPEAVAGETLEQAPKEVKPRVRKITGQVKEPELIELRKEFTAAAKTAREAYKAGKDYAAVKEARKLKNILARTRKLRIVRDYFNLTDTELKKISQKNPLLLSQYEFKLYLDDVRSKAAQLSETNLEKAMLINMIHEKDLGRVDNYRRVLGLPTIANMTVEQVRTFAAALEPFHDGDVFLSERELETVDRTDLAGIATWREAKERLAKEIGVSIEELEKIKVKEWDEYKWDTSLAESNPFYKMLVTETTRKLLEADMRYHEIETELFDLARKSEKSRNRTLVEKAIPQDRQVMEYLETPAEERVLLVEEMTKEQVDFARYMEAYFEIALEYLIKTKSLDRGRENYFVHMRRSFLENVKEEGLVGAFKDLFKAYQEDEAVFNIMDEDTGNILPLEKFFQFSLRRTGGIDPTTNVTKAFLTYAQMMEKKISLDELIPKMDIYAQSITPTMYTPRGLEIDRSIKKFVNKYINNKKGRRIRWIAKQGGTIDVSIRGLRAFTTLIDLGLNIPSGIAAFVGEQATNFEMLGIKGYTKGNTRIKTKKGKAILNKYESFVGRSAWEEFTAPGKQITERVSVGLFGLFHEASVLANKQFLLGAITDAEYNSGELSTERLAQIKIEMGRFRVVPGTKSLVGSTSAGSAMMQYKTWASPIIRTLSKDMTTLVSDLIKKPAGEALTTREAREIYRLIGLSTTALIVGATALSESDDDTFTGQILKRIYRESMTLLQGVDPEMWGSVPRVLTFIKQLLANISSIAQLEEYKTKPGLKGVDGLQRQLTPRLIKQFIPKETKKEKL